MSVKDVQVEKLFPSGGILCYAVVCGTLERRRYFGYTKREAVQLFIQELGRKS